MVIIMSVYIDVVFVLNFFFDFILLMTVSVTLKRNASIKKLIIGALCGELSMLILFFNFNNITLFLFKLFNSILMIIVTFKLKDKKYFWQNLAYFYMTSTVLGGFLYFLSLSYRENQYGLVFVYESYTIPYLFLVIISPIILYIYIKQRKEIYHYNCFIPVTINFKNGKKLTLMGYLDTANKLIDPITKKKVIIVNQRVLKKIVTIRSPVYVPYNSLNNHGLLKCIAIKSIVIKGVTYNDYLLGLSIDNLLKDGVDCLLNSYYLEERK